jgi:aminopeptidase
MDDKHLINYAKLIAKVGLNVQKGQDIMLTCGLDQPKFIHMLVKELYECGARKVFVTYSDPELTKLDIQYENVEDLGKVETFEKDKQEYIADHYACRLFIESDDPDALKGVDFKKYSKAMQMRRKVFQPIRDRFDNYVQWCIAGVPSIGWAKKVFPELDGDEAIEALWEAILKVSRAWEGDPIKNWEEHDANLAQKKNKLNEMHLEKLVYKSKNGTDFTVHMIPDCLWAAGGEYGQTSRIYFQPNIPSEECFTTPMKGKCEGIVFSTKPLSYNSNIIEDFSIRFEDGKVKEIHAKKGEEFLQELIKMDEGSAMLGECALIPFHSPINDTKLIFFSTLYDENAACHLALGCGFENLIVGYEKMTLEEIRAKGINNSMSHVDFMIGSEDLDVVGYDKDGKKYQIFKKGNWAF